MTDADDSLGVSREEELSLARAYKAAVEALPGTAAACYRASRQGPVAIAVAKAQFSLDDTGFSQAAGRGTSLVESLPERLAFLAYNNRIALRFAARASARGTFSLDDFPPHQQEIIVRNQRARLPRP